MRKWIFVTVSCFLLGGCFSVASPEQNHYLLQVTMPAQQHKTKRARVIAVNMPLIAQQFASRYFVYRTSHIQYRTDFYNLFLLQPNQQLQQILINYLNRLSTVRQAVDESNPQSAIWKLHSRITELYADYRDRAKPTAIMSIDFSFFRDQHGKPQLIFQKTYTERTPLQAKDSESLVNAWSVDLSNILKQLSRRI